MSENNENLKSAKESSIFFGKSLTLLNFETILDNYFEKSNSSERVTFNLSQVEWVSLFELILLLQWINHLSSQGIKIDVIFPTKEFLHGVDETEIGVLSDHPIQEPMFRRKRVLEFLSRLRVFQEIHRITEKREKSREEYLKSVNLGELGFDDYSDPYDAKILSVTAFWDKKDIDVDKELSNKKLLKLLKEHSCLDPIDSGMLANVVIQELASNAIEHAIKGNKEKCAWVTARLVKSSKSTISEMPKWYSQAFKSLLGRHYIELSICDNGPGIFKQLKGHVPLWVFRKGVSVKATLDFAFDKFSSSASEFRTDMESMPRGLFYVFDLVRQYKGILTVRSGGFYMAYDFLTRDKHPRLLGLFNEGGACTEIGGTAIQIILPQSEGFYLSTSYSDVKANYKEPIIIDVDPTKLKKNEIEKYTKEIIKEIESHCQSLYEIPILVDTTDLNFKDYKQYLLFLKLMNHIIWLENPNLIWVLAPRERHILEHINNLLLSKKSNLEDAGNGSEQIFKNLNNFDLNVVPVLFPNTEIFWLGVSEEISFLLNNIWGGGKIELSEFGDKSKIFYELAVANPHLINVEKNIMGQEPVASLTVGNYDIEFSLPKILKETCAHLLHVTPHVINRNGCYHLPHGAYSKEYFYLKPLLSQRHFARKLARYLIYLLSFYFHTKDLEIEVIVGGTHSAKRLITLLGEEYNCQILTIDRYVGQIDEAIVGEKVAKKNILVVSDVISSGTFMSKIVTRLKNEDANIKAIACICDIRPNNEAANIDNEIPVISLFRYPVERQSTPSAEPIFEVNPISLRPTLPEDEIVRNHIPSLLSSEKLLEWINNSESLVSAHLVLGPTHYTYFFDTKKLLDKYGDDIFETVITDADKVLQNYASDNKKKVLNIETDLSAVITAEDSNAELFFPEMIRKKYPEVAWVQVERIRLNLEGTWQLDRLDPQLDPLDKIRNKLVLIFDDGSNTGGTLTQLIEVVSEYEPKIILAYCVVNRLSANRSRFFSRLPDITAGDRTVVKFFTNVPMTTFVHSSCPICNREEPKFPPLDEFIDHNSHLKDLHKIQRWNHLSADSINEKARKNIYKRGFNNVNQTLSDIYKVRSLLGYFENYVNIPKDIRDNLLFLLKDCRYIASLCYILNREPQLLYSVINFQIREFDNYFLKSIMEIIDTDVSNSEIYGGIDILEYLVKRYPDIASENIELLMKSLIIDPERCVIFLYNILYEKDLTKVYDRLTLILNKTGNIENDKETTVYLRGLINSCISWLNIEKIRDYSDDSRKAINDLQSFYREGARHGEASDLGKPFNRILNYVHFYEKSQKVRHKNHYNSIYRDWRDYTVRCIEERLLYSFKTIKGIIGAELSATLQNYYDLESDTGVKKDYLRLQRHLSHLRETEDQVSYLKNNKDEMKRQVRRISDYLFSETKSPIAKIVKNIPVYIVKHTKQRISNNLPWIQACRIDLIEKINISEVSGFMTVRIFKQILDRIFLNIKKHNFALTNNIIEQSKKLEDPKILIDINIKHEELIIEIKSNGPNLYEDRPGQGLRENYRNCRVFSGEYRIDNIDNWVVNTITIKRW